MAHLQIHAGLLHAPHPDRSLEVATLVIDGQPLQEWIESARTGMTADGYMSPKPEQILPPSQNLWGRPDRTWPAGWQWSGEPYEGVVGLLRCSCGETGCMSLVADFEVAARHVSWRRLRHATAASHPGIPWPLNPPPDLTFDREQYGRAVTGRPK